MTVRKKISGTVLGLNKTYLGFRQSSLEAATEKRIFHKQLNKNSRLSKDEKNEIKSKWGKIVPCIPRGYSFYEGIKALYGFNSDYLSSAYFLPYIETILNPPKYKSQMSHKSMTELLYGTDFKYPQTILRSYGGSYLDSSYHPVSDDQAARIISNCQTSVIFKPAVETNQGTGIRYVDKNSLNKLASVVQSREIFNNNPDFVIQVPVSQSSETLIYNPTSLNCMRVTTLSLNGTISVCSRALKCGPKNSVVDNIGTGRRGVIVGISPDGRLSDHGFYGNGDIATEHNGVAFKGNRIPHFPELEQTALRLHTHAPSCHIIGWDLALDQNNNPILIEGNVVYPGIMFEQICSGPIFGERTQEVIDYVAFHIKNR